MGEFPHTIQCRPSLKPRNLSLIERVIQFLELTYHTWTGRAQFPRSFRPWDGLAKSRGRLL